jgi:hypothetical protein
MTSPKGQELPFTKDIDIFGADVPKKIQFVLKIFPETQKLPSIETTRISRPAKENQSIHCPIPPPPPASPFPPQQLNNT